MKIGESFHLGYCSNIHAGETWPEVEHNLTTFLPAVRRQLGHEGSFGIGLRLSAEAASALEAPATLARFQAFLAEGDFYVFTINGFPYGTFHRERVKEGVYLPDWKDGRRVEYTNRLAGLLAKLVPEGIVGSVSTVPGAFRPRVATIADIDRMARNILHHVCYLREIKAKTGQTITLAIEPEPCCHIETIDEAIRFFHGFLLDSRLLSSMRLSETDIRAHVGLCFDACHMAVEFEEPADALRRLKQAGIPVFKFQISSALRLRFSDYAETTLALEPFAESTYLHQVVERSDSGLRRFVDLPEAFEVAKDGGAGEKEWRIHFHVPIFLPEKAAGLSTTQNYLIELLSLLKRDAGCPYLEVETYTWDVLPAAYRNVDITTAIAQELGWVVKQLAS